MGSTVRRALAGGLVAMSAVAGIGAASGQAYPARTVTIVVPWPAGGPTDALARIVAQPMSDVLKQQVIVENVGGATGTVGAARVARAAPDGYTLFLHNVGHATAPSLYKSLPYDPVADFEPIALVADVPQAVVARKDFGAASLAELVASLKSNPGKVNMANAGRGSGSHLCALMLMSAIGTKLTEVAYRGTGPAVTDLMGGQVDLMCDQVSNTGSQIRAGTIRSYCVTVGRRIASLPDVPPCAEAGLPGFAASVWNGLYAPRGTPPEIVRAVGDALRTALRDPAVRARLIETGAEPETEARATPGALRDHLKAEIDKWAAVIREAGLQRE